MMKRPWLSLLVFAILTIIVACEKKEPSFFSESARRGTAEAPVKEVPKDVLATQQAFTELAKKVTPAVVNISTISKKKVIEPFFEFSPLFEDFFGERRGRPHYRREKSLGSGFIINKEGYLLTNDHVVRDAESIQVKLSNEKVYKGKVVGADPKTDIAVVKINASEDLPFAVLGDSDKLLVGQWAIAIGNPFGLDRTFTVGVISATGRSNMGIETYEDFIQTDASINPGNSGGPLLNIYGEVIGINTAIVAAGQGIGFAIPINMAKQELPQLIQKGHVARGWLGVSIQPVTQEIARSFGYNKSKGALVSDVIGGSPAAEAGIRQGDIITRFAGNEVKDVQHLQRMAAETPAGKSVDVEVFRKGKLVKLSLTMGSAERSQQRQVKPREMEPSNWMGLTVDALPPSMQMQGARGVVVTDVEAGSIADEGGLQQGDIIVSINQRPIASLTDFKKVAREAEKKGSVALLVKRGDASIYFAFRVK